MLKLLNASDNSTYETKFVESKWKRLRTDYSDYDFLINVSGFGRNEHDNGPSEDKWNELDESRGPSQLKKSRFKNISEPASPGLRQ